MWGKGLEGIIGFIGILYLNEIVFFIEDEEIFFFKFV